MNPPGSTDPFASIDEPRTFIKPNPGGRASASRAGSGSLALHVAGEFPGLELELWAIRQ